jgi:hypothetical protein
MPEAVSDAECRAKERPEKEWAGILYRWVAATRQIANDDQVEVGEYIPLSVGKTPSF